MLSHKTIRRFEEFTFVMPALILFLAFVVYPFFSGFPLSFYKWDGMSPQKTFVGLNNYLRFFQDRNVGNAVKNTLVFTILSMVCSNLIGLSLALLLHRSTRFNSVCRTVIFVPYCLSLVLSSYIWRYVYSDVFYGMFRIPSPLGSTEWVMLGLAVIAIWRDCSYCMVVYIAAIQGISPHFYEAAQIAAFHSKGNRSENVPVDYTKVRYVKKPNGAKPGMVIFTDNHTVYVEPKRP